MQRSMKTRALRTVKAALSCFLSAGLALYMPVMAYANDPWNISDGDIAVHRTSETEQNVSQGTRSENDNNPTITGTSSEHTVTIVADQGTTATVTFENLNIDKSESGSSNENGDAAVSTSGEGSVVIEMNGDNNLQSGFARAGFEKSNAGNLTIQDVNNTGAAAGSMTATGGQFGAGIGGGRSAAGSGIAIEGGTITATGGELGAGIGGGSGGAGSGITIEGGTITATGGELGAGIGGGWRAAGSGIAIEGGTVTATGGSSGAGIGGGWSAAGNNITISGTASVSVAGGDSYGGNNFGAAIGYGGGNVTPGESVDPITDGLYATGSIKIYNPGTSAENMANTAPQQVIEGEVPDPNENQDPVNPGPVNPSSNTANAIQTAENSARTDEATSTAPATEKDSDAAFNTAVDMQIDDLLRQLYSLLEAGKLNEANALIAKGFVINAGTHKGFDRVTLEKLGELSRAGVAVTINFTYAGVNYSVMIPAKSEIDPASLIDESGYCGFLNLM